jgi:hypothetical protein
MIAALLLEPIPKPSQNPTMLHLRRNNRIIKKRKLNIILHTKLLSSPAPNATIFLSAPHNSVEKISFVSSILKVLVSNISIKSFIFSSLSVAKVVSTYCPLAGLKLSMFST